MTELIESEVQEICYMLYGGMAVSMLFYLRDYLSKRVGKYICLARILYFFFWILAAFLAYQFAYKGAYGVLTWYSFTAFGCGIILWNKVFYDILSLYRYTQKQNGDTKDEEKKKRPAPKIRRTKSQLGRASEPKKRNEKKRETYRK